jgi:hypothetical protein
MAYHPDTVTSDDELRITTDGSSLADVEAKVSPTDPTKPPAVEVASISP